MQMIPVFVKVQSLIVMGITTLSEQTLQVVLIYMSIIIGMLFFISIRNYSRSLKAQKEYKAVQETLEESCMELEAVNRQMLASEEELNRQFVEIQEQKDKLKISRERYVLAADGAEFGIWDLDNENQSLYLSKKAKEIMGFQNMEAGQVLDEFKSRIVEGDRLLVFERFQKHTNKEVDFFEVQFRFRVSQGKYSWLSVRGKGQMNEYGKIIRIAGSVSNINKEKLSEAKIQRLAFYDSLTGLPNRSYFSQLMESYIHNLKVEYFTVLFLDIDNFKSINDSLGHTYGDKILKQIVKKLEKHVNSLSELIRFGGDEFVILIPHLRDKEEIEDYASQIINTFRTPFEIEGFAYPVTLSIGIATYPNDGLKPDELLKHADLALNEVKTNGKNDFKFFESELNDNITSRLKLESDLRRAIEHNEFELFYQPKLDISENRILGYEALIRWKHPERGYVSPMDFIPLAEETGLIIPIGEWVIYEAAKQLREWHDQGFNKLTVAVNLSAKQLSDRNLLALFKSVKEMFRIDLGNMEIEITESTALDDTKGGIEIMSQLRSLGLKLSLDDFGTGYSSLNYITLLPLDYLKIDKSFVQNTTENQSGKEIIKAVITLAHACNLKVIAEGVETHAQLEQMREESCDMVQGFLISKPLPHLAAIKLVDEYEHINDIWIDKAAVN